MRRRDDYSFINTSSSFGYHAGYKIPLDRYVNLFGVTKGMQLHSNSGPWGSSCFGFSTSTSEFFFDPSASPNQDDVIIIAPRSVGDNDAKQMRFRID